MKKLFILFTIILSVVSYSQESHNPDGRYVSFHFTPLYCWGNNTVTSSIFSNEKEYDLSSKFNFDFRMKMPLSNSFTITFIYTHQAVETQYPYAGSLTESVFTNKASYNNIGMTLSFYIEN